MGKKEDIAKLRKKLFDKKKQEVIEKAVEQQEKEVKKSVESLQHTAYTIIQDDSKRGRHFLIAKIKLDINSGKIVLDEVREFEDKAAGLAFVMNNNNLKFLFNKNKRREA
jgi:carbonic anhydrase